MLDGGKRLRPLLVLAACEATQGLRDAAMRAAVAVELIHAYSLVHDDMPCMDNDVLRRGKPTVHVRYGQAQAMLAGDAMQALAFEVLTPEGGAVPAPLQARLCGLLARAAGHAGMAGGQAIDLASIGKSLDEASLRDMHRRKTGALLQASVLMGAACGRVDARLAGAVRLRRSRRPGVPGGRRHPGRDPTLRDAGQDRRQGPERQQAHLRVAARPRGRARHAADLRDLAQAALARSGLRDTQRLRCSPTRWSTARDDRRRRRTHDDDESRLLSAIASPADLRKLSRAQLAGSPPSCASTSCRRVADRRAPVAATWARSS